jgi:hypothetical protein
MRPKALLFAGAKAGQQIIDDLLELGDGEVCHLFENTWVVAQVHDR